MKYLLGLISLMIFPLLVFAGPPSPIIWGPGATAKNIASGGLTLNGLTVVNQPGSYLNFDTGSVTAIIASQVVGLGKTARAMYFENASVIAATGFTCSTNPTFTIYDCGTTVTSGCTSGQTSTMGTATLTAASTEVDASITTNTIAAAHYWAVLITAGACTVLNATGSIEARMQ